MTPRSIASFCAVIAIAATAQAQPLRNPAPQPVNPVLSAPPPTPAVALETGRERPQNSIVAQVDAYIITLDDVLRETNEVAESIRAQVALNGGSRAEYEKAIDKLMNDTIQELIDNRLLINEFRTPKEGQKDIPRIPESFVKSVINSQITERFDDDRLKFHAWLQKRGQTQADFAREVEESIIIDYMKSQRSKSRSIVSPVKIEQYYKDNKEAFFEPDKVKFRLLQLNRNGRTDAELTAAAQEMINRVKAGEKFEDLVKQYSDDTAKRAVGGEYPENAKNDMVPAFRDPVFDSKPGGLEVGEMTTPIIFQDAVFVLYVTGREHAGIQPIEKVRPDIENILARQMTMVDAERYMERLRKKAYIKYF